MKGSATPDYAIDITNGRDPSNKVQQLQVAVKEEHVFGVQHIIKAI